MTSSAAAESSAAVMKLCEASSNPQIGLSSEAASECRAKLTRGRHRCDALVELQDDAESDELTLLRRACYASFECQFVSQTSSSTCREAALNSLLIPGIATAQLVSVRWSHVIGLVKLTVERAARRGGYAASVLLDALTHPERDLSGGRRRPVLALQGTTAAHSRLRRAEHARRHRVVDSFGKVSQTSFSCAASQSMSAIFENLAPGPVLAGVRLTHGAAGSTGSWCREFYANVLRAGSSPTWRIATPNTAEEVWASSS